MKLIVGLGNPGKIYQGSRHNIGCAAVEAFARAHAVTFKRERLSLAFTAKCEIAAETVILATPLTFMNLSGGAVKALFKKYEIAPAQFLAVCDDLDLTPGDIRIKPRGSSGGHNGINSIIDALETNEFARLRIGIGRPPALLEPAEFVLMPFLKKDTASIKDALSKAVSAMECWLAQGVTCAMNSYNQRQTKENEA